MTDNQEAPAISVIMPARNCPDQLRKSIPKLQQSELRNFQLIVVDDASTDDTPEVAEELGAQVVRLTEQGGPARARNNGASVATAPILLFIDADVCVQPTTLGQFVQSFAEDETAAAAFGSYDDRPKAGNIISQYRNLLHHFVHQQGQREASTFWAGCGAVRRDIFRKIGGYDPNYRRPCIEDIELGVRLKKAGYRIVLDSEIQVTHLKHWTFWGMLKADIFDRAIPWTNLILTEKDCPNDLNVKSTQRLSVVLTAVLLVLFAIACYFAPLLLLAPVASVLFFAAIDHWSVERRIPTLVRLLAVSVVLVICYLIATRFAFWSFIPIALIVVILLMNLPFYVFMARSRGPLFAVLALPLQLLFYLYCGGAFAWGVMNHLFGRFSKSSDQVLAAEGKATKLPSL